MVYIFLVIRQVVLILSLVTCRFEGYTLHISSSPPHFNTKTSAASKGVTFLNISVDRLPCLVGEISLDFHK